MAGNAKPTYEVNGEARYSLLGGSATNGSPYGLFDGTTPNAWNTATVFYWSDSSSWIEVEFLDSFRLHRYYSWSNSNNQRLKIMKYDGVGYNIDLTPKHLDTSIQTTLTWMRFTEALEAGKYRFVLDSTSTGFNGRVDGEWYVERMTVGKILLSSGNKYYSLLNDGIQKTTSIPKMTSNTTPEGEVLVSNAPNGNMTFGWEAFDGGLSTNWGGNALPTTMPKWIGYKFKKPKVIVKYRLYVTNTTYYPRNYEFQGSNDGVNYDTLHSIVGGPSGVLDYAIENRKSYTHYRLYITSLSSGTALPAVYELEMFEMKPSYLIQMESITESDYLNKGVEKLTGFNQILKLKKNLLKNNQILGSGKTFEHIIDMSKRRVDKITLG